MAKKKSKVEQQIDAEFEKQYGIKSNNSSSTDYDHSVTEKQRTITTDQGVKLRYGSKSIKTVGNKQAKKYINDLEKKSGNSSALYPRQ